MSMNPVAAALAGATCGLCLSAVLAWPPITELPLAAMLAIWTIPAILMALSAFVAAGLGRKRGP